MHPLDGSDRMKRQSEQHVLSYSAEQMFDLAADIERYPEFLPHWTAARIRTREGDRLRVDQELDVGVRRLRFTSEALLQRPRRLQIRSVQAPFRTLLIEWTFAPLDAASCRVGLTVEFDMQSALLETAVGKLMQHMTRDIFTRFRERAGTLYALTDPDNQTGS